MAAIGLQLPPTSPQGLPQESSSIEAFVTQDTEEAEEGEEALLWRKMIADLLQESPQALKLGQSVRHSYLQYRVHPSSPRTEWKCPSLLISDEHLNRAAFSRTDSLIIFLK